MKSENVVPLNNLAGTEHSQAVRDCKTTIHKHLDKLIKEMLDNVDDFLFDLAEKADTNQKQATYFDAMRIIRLRRESIEKNYKHRIDAQFNLGLTSHLSEPKAKPDALLSADNAGAFDLLENEELEESLAITNMVSKMSSQLNHELFALAQRFNLLLSTQQFTEENQPLSVEMLCSAFCDALSALEDDATIEIKLIIYKLYERFVLVGFPQLYADLNNILIKAGILPTIKNNIKRPNVSPQLQNQCDTQDFLDDSVEQNAPQTQYAQEPISHTPSNTHPSNIDTGSYQHLRNLLPQNASTHNAHESETFAESLPDPLETRKVIDSLTSLQQHATSYDIDTLTSIHSASNLKDAINLELNAGGDSSEAQSLNHDYSDTIDIIAMLFEFILDDNNLNPAMKALIARLQIPILKIAMLDKRFFSHNTHPARRLLNEMARICVGWDGSDDLENDTLYQGISNIVQRILSEFNDNAEIFDELLDELKNLYSINTENEETLQQRIEQVRDKVAQTIEEYISNPDIPEEVKLFIRTRWSEVLMITYEQHGEESSEWKAAVDVIDNLIWSIQPKPDATERKLLLMMIPQMLEEIEKGLALAKVDEEVYKIFNLQLEKLHLCSMRTSSQRLGSDEIDENDESIDDQSLDDSEEIILESITEEETTQELTDALNKVDNLTLGTWIEFTYPDKNPVRGKLIWKDDYFDSYTFVNRRFKVVVDDNKKGIAQRFHDNNAHVVDNVPLIDRALDAITDKLAKLSSAKQAEA